MINVELSSIWSCVSLPQLLACEKDLFDAHLHLRSNQPVRRSFWAGSGSRMRLRQRRFTPSGRRARRFRGSVIRWWWLEAERGIWRQRRA